MSVAQDRRVDPVDGEIIGESAVKVLGVLLIGLVFIPLGAWLAWAWWAEASWLGFQLTSTAGLGGVVMLLLGVVGVPACVLLLLRSGRLILGQDRLQYATKQGRVLTQIPYRNIDRVDLVREPEQEKCIGIDLKDPADPETLNVGGEEMKRWSGWHYRIADSGWLLPLEQIHERLQRRLGRARARP